ncbi:MAG: PadR family transcriptional regulator [Aquificota bacterium]|nr:MAG: PadR family transcriptional regulator [Aquificota bacterium]
MEKIDAKALQREILLGFWKIHILHHAAECPVIGQWMIQELRRHGYVVSPGRMYPLIARLEERGWLKHKTDSDSGSRAKKEYSLTKSGREALVFLKTQIEELYHEVILDEKKELKQR